ncbi:hypothetical protein J5837_03160 [Pseudoxanthomonas helianthi]|uniref:Secreted protein n=1 Tax=Pseudoxanthomonas helianthi TaxID=1453541 RepID=A0A940X0E6_9GAMM|nr:hypothetical protein [Pseudoxanthomonas helianthi]MBP3983412.1 hypothetical protein [Pseudoxanthomonas helianthi]
MKSPSKSRYVLAALVGSLGLALGSATAAEKDLECKLDYTLDGWSLVYEEATGSGTVHCGKESLPVSIKARAIGATVGKWKVDKGRGRFTDVHAIDEVLGKYVKAEADVGVVKSGSAQLLTKGTVSLALAGTGEGVTIGVDVGQFELSPR